VVWFSLRTTYLLFHVGRAAEHWLKDLSWAGLVIAVLVGLISTWWLRRRARQLDPEPGPAKDRVNSGA
jgi:hypothetical protein